MIEADLYPNEFFIVSPEKEFFIYICIIFTQLYVTAN